MFLYNVKTSRVLTRLIDYRFIKKFKLFSKIFYQGRIQGGGQGAVLKGI